MGRLLDAIKAKIDMDFPNLISPYRKTRRYGMTGEFDFDVKYSEGDNLERLFLSFVQEAEKKGDTKEVVASVKVFMKRYLKIINYNELAQKGLLVHIRDRINDWHLQKKKLEKALAQKDIAKHITPDLHRDLVALLHKWWGQIFQKVRDDTLWMSDLELDEARGAQRLRDFKLQVDFSIKSDLGHFATRERDIERNEDKKIKTIEGLISKHQGRIDEEMEKDLKELFDFVIVEMNLMKAELRDLLILIRNLKNALDKTYERQVKQVLINQMKLPNDAPESPGRLIEKEFNETRNLFISRASQYFQEAKYVAQKAA